MASIVAEFQWNSQDSKGLFRPVRAGFQARKVAIIASTSQPVRRRFLALGLKTVRSITVVAEVAKTFGESPGNAESLGDFRYHKFDTCFPNETKQSVLGQQLLNPLT